MSQTQKTARVCETCGAGFHVKKPSIRRRFCGLKCASASRVTIRHGGAGTRLYRIWVGMIARCKYPSQSSYASYGGRGIRVCEEWQADFATFREWATEAGYTDDLAIDRIDSNGNYEPSNCRWVTRTVNSRNTRKRKDGVSSRFKGVSREMRAKGANKFKAHTSLKGKPLWIGAFETELEAALAYDAKVFSLTGDARGLNFPERFAVPTVSSK